jgi:TRAP-type mannitol/chloroaromatic compound transport system permease small subunit
MQKILKIINSINEWVGKILSIGPFLMAVIVMCDVIPRYLFNAPTKFSLEINEFMLLVVSWLAGGYVLKNNAHVNVDIICKLFPVRAKAIIDMITSVLLFSFCGILIWRGWELSLHAFQLHEASQILKLPLFLFYLVIPFGAFLIIIQGFAQFINNLMIAIYGGGIGEIKEGNMLGIKKYKSSGTEAKGAH